jgi:hypothetical protein
MKRNSKILMVALLYYAIIGVLVLALLGVDEFLNSNHHDWPCVAVLAVAVVTTVTIMWRSVVHHLEQY